MDGIAWANHKYDIVKMVQFSIAIYFAYFWSIQLNFEITRENWNSTFAGIISTIS